MRYIIEKDGDWEKDIPPVYEIGNKINGRRVPLYVMDHFMISQLDESYFDDDLFRAVSKMWKDNVPEEEVKKFYKENYHKKNKKLYDDTMIAHINMRKKKTSKAKPKRKVVKKCRCK